MNITNAQQTTNTLRGTPAELAGHISLNGRMLEQPDISFLTRMGAAKKIGTSKKSGYHGGKPATIWEFNPKLTMKFEVFEPQLPAPALEPVRDTSNDAPRRTDANNVDDNDNAPITRKDMQEIIVRAVAEAVQHLQGPKGQASPSNQVAEEVS